MLNFLYATLLLALILGWIAFILYRADSHGGKNQKDSASQQFQAFRAAGGSARLNSTGKMGGLM